MFPCRCSLAEHESINFFVYLKKHMVKSMRCEIGPMLVWAIIGISEDDKNEARPMCVKEDFSSLMLL